jgi:hypothetical protein
LNVSEDDTELSTTDKASTVFGSHPPSDVRFCQVIRQS